MAASERQQRVVIGLDPHKRSVTIEVMTADEIVLLAAARYATDPAGFAQMRRDVAGFCDRVWAMCHRSCRPRSGSMRSGRAARPMPPTLIPSLWPAPGPRGYGR